MILSVRGRVWYADDGTIGGIERWARRLEEGGSLDGVLDMADSAGDAPYSWLVDPAVLVALRRLAVGNPTRSIAPDPRPCPGRSRRPPRHRPRTTTTEPAPAPVETLTPPSTGEEPELSEDEALLATAAAAWLDRFKDLVGAQPVLTLPFGDLDVSAAVRNDAIRYDQAVARSAEVMAALELPTQPAVAPGDDVLSPEAIAPRRPTPSSSSATTPSPSRPTTPNSVVRLLGHKVVVTSTGAEAGGPGPDRRQRPARPAPAAAQRGGAAPGRRRHRPAGRDPPDRVARRGRRVVLLRARPALARPRAGRRDRRARSRGACRPPSLAYTEDDREAELERAGLHRGRPGHRRRHPARAGAHPADHDRGAGPRRGAGDAVRAAPRPTPAGAARGRSRRASPGRRPRQDHRRGADRRHPVQRRRPPRRHPRQRPRPAGDRAGRGRRPTASSRSPATASASSGRRRAA